MPWLPASVLQTGGTLDFTLTSSPDPAWGSSPADVPPSFGSGVLPAVGFSSPSGATTVVVGQPTTVQLGVALASSQAASVRWQVAPDAGGPTVSPSSGTLTLAAPAKGAGSSAQCGVPSRATQSLTLTAATAGSDSVHITLSTTGGIQLPPVVLDVVAQP